MSFIENKRDIVTNLSTLEVLGEQAKTKKTTSLSSIESKSKNIAPYLIDLLAITCKDKSSSPNDISRCTSKRILNEILTEFFASLIRILKDGIIKGIKASLIPDVDFTLPPQTQIKLKLSEIDFNGLFKINPTSTIGSTFYGKSPNEDLNWFLSNLIQNGGTSNWKNLLDFTYDQNNEEISVSVDSSAQGKKLEEFVTVFMNSTELISEDTFMTKITDNLTGSLKSSFLPSLDQLISEEKVNESINKINNSDPCKKEYESDDNYFTFTNDELYKIEENARKKLSGSATLDLGCGLVEATIDPGQFKVIFDNIRNASTNEVKLVIDESLTVLNSALTSNVSDSDKETATQSLNTKILEEIPKVLTSVILEPKIVVLYLMASKIVNGPLFPVNDTPTIKVNTSFDFSKLTKTFFEYVSRESLASIIKIIFDKLKKEIILLVTSTSARIIKEQTKLKYKALTGVALGTATNTLVGLISSKDLPGTSESS